MRNLIGASIALLAAGCGEPPASTPAADTAPATALAPGLATPAEPDVPLHNEWIADIRSDTVSVHFGYRDSDFIGLSMRCAPGAGRMSIYTPSFDLPVIELVSGDASEAFPAEVEKPRPDYEGWELHVSTNDGIAFDRPVLVNFRRTGNLDLRQPDREASAKTDAERSEIETFFAACEPAEQN